MKTMKFRCELRSDVILNMKSVAEGSNKTLDFIPGSNFLGMVAAQLYESEGPAAALDLFHNGTVRYGDAHLAIGGRRSLKVPAAMYHPKLKQASEELYIYYAYDREKDPEKQLKQCREGFYAFGPGKGVAAEIEGVAAETKKSFAIKSAYDKFARRSKDEQMFGYEALRAGLEFYFTVETDKDEYAEKIEGALLGLRHLGRSRNAQYGLVRITRCDFEETPSDTAPRAQTPGQTTVYADSRLVFLDACGEPTFQPTAEDLGIEGGHIDWKSSQIRTFQYAPWNARRQAYDTDRCGIEKGSVFVVDGGRIANTAGRALGSYVNEGFGKVIYNPAFLAVEASANGKAKCRLRTDEEQWPDRPAAAAGESTPLLRFLEARQKEEAARNAVYKAVNKFVADHGTLFMEAAFASQWGTIRSIATSMTSAEKIKMELFDKTRIRKGKSEPFAYLTHGVAKDKWAKGRRLETFRTFFREMSRQYDDALVREALVNLASQMQKLYRKESKNG